MRSRRTPGKGPCALENAARGVDVVSFPRVELGLPDWLDDFVADADREYSTGEDRIRLMVELSAAALREYVERDGVIYDARQGEQSNTGGSR